MAYAAYNNGRLLPSTTADTYEAAKRIAEAHNKKYDKITVIVDNTWLVREQEAWFDEYTRPYLPDWVLDWSYENNHFVHLHPTEPGYIRYTASAEHGMLRRYTKTTVGKYLTKFFSDDMSKATIEMWANKNRMFGNESLILFARTADEIERIYTHDASFKSCMAHSVDNYTTDGVHPVRAYGDSDLSLAYLLDTSDPDHHEVLARVIVWEDRLLYGRIYGDEHRMLHQLKLHNPKWAYYKDVDDNYGFTGARIRKHYIDHSGWLAPYLDGNTGIDFESDPNYLIISAGRGSAEANLAGGLLNGGAWCDHCEQYHSLKTRMYTRVNDAPGKMTAVCHHCMKAEYPIWEDTATCKWYSSKYHTPIHAHWWDERTAKWCEGEDNHHAESAHNPGSSLIWSDINQKFLYSWHVAYVGPNADQPVDNNWLRRSGEYKQDAVTGIWHPIGMMTCIGEDKIDGVRVWQGWITRSSAIRNGYYYNRHQKAFLKRPSLVGVVDDRNKKSKKLMEIVYDELDDFDKLILHPTTLVTRWQNAPPIPNQVYRWTDQGIEAVPPMDLTVTEAQLEQMQRFQDEIAQEGEF
jgi:hypothetical protein